MIFLLIFSVFAFTDEELDKGRACSKIVIDLFAKDFHMIGSVTNTKPHFDSKRLENKIFADLIDYCYENTPYSAIESIKYNFGMHSWKEFQLSVKISPENYNEEKDLEISKAHLYFRKELLNSEKEPKYVGDPALKSKDTKEITEKFRAEQKKKQAERANEKVEEPETIKILRERRKKRENSEL